MSPHPRVNRPSLARSILTQTSTTPASYMSQSFILPASTSRRFSPTESEEVKRSLVHSTSLPTNQFVRATSKLSDTCISTTLRFSWLGRFCNTFNQYHSHDAKTEDEHAPRLYNSLNYHIPNAGLLSPKWWKAMLNRDFFFLTPPLQKNTRSLEKH